MDNVKYVTDENGNEHAIIDRGNGEFISMLKSTYDELQAKIDEIEAKLKVRTNKLANP